MKKDWDFVPILIYTPGKGHLWDYCLNNHNTHYTTKALPG